MQINYLGASCFKIKTKKASLLTDPPSVKALGFTLPKLETDIVLLSLPSSCDLLDLSRVKNDPFIIEAPGEYEIKEISVLGLPLVEERVYVIAAEGLRLAYLNSSNFPDEKTLEKLDGLDGFLFRPNKASLKLIRELEPSLLLPFGYTQAELENFQKEYGSEGEKTEKLVISKGSLGEESKLIILTSSRLLSS